MKAVLLSIGTRGDMEPFLALARFLQKLDWEVTCGFPEQFRAIVMETDLDFYGFDKRFLELLDGTAGRTIMGGEGNFISRFKAYFTLSRSAVKLQNLMVAEQRDLIRQKSPDLIFYHPKCVYPVVWEHSHPGATVMVSPMPCVLHPMSEQSIIAFRGNGDFGPWLNLLSYRLVNSIRFRVFKRVTRKYHKDAATKVNASTIKEVLMKKTKTIYAVSPSLFPRPRYWPEHLRVSGYFERDKSSHWVPSSALTTFLEQYQKVLFITFGSMRNRRPQEITKSVIQVLQRYRIPAIINTSWGGLVPTAEVPESVHFVSDIPYDWIFPKVYAVVHHGGSGTTHSACKYACPSLVIPHIVDQYFWNKTIHRSKLGPMGIPINKLNAARLGPLIRDLWENRSYKQAALRISNQMKNENWEDQLMGFLTL